MIVSSRNDINATLKTVEARKIHIEQETFDLPPILKSANDGAHEAPLL